ncbi:MAG: hypothetical protein M3416_17615 [Acidobacteriota bacterium]|nr:hypothetical protein [Acidobacteriota bacterium]
MRPVFDHELMSLRMASFESSLYFALSGMSLSAFVSFLLAVTTGTITNDRTYAVYVAVTVVTAFLTLLFAGLAVAAQIKLNGSLRTIREGASTETEMMWSETGGTWIPVPPSEH